MVVCKNAVVKFSSGYGIIVEVGGTLYLENCTITHANDDYTNPAKINKCGDYWNGIFVKGNPNESQEITYKKTCNLLEGCVNWNNNGTDEIMGMNDCWNASATSHIQGLVYAKNVNIRQAKIGINMGDLARQSFTPSGPQGGGLLIAKNCRFTNFENAAISYAPYTKFLNMSQIINDTFECASKVRNATGFTLIEMCGIIAGFNTFNFPISQNYFFRATNSISRYLYGIRFEDCFANVSNNKFQNLSVGTFIWSSSVPLKKAIQVQNNIAVDCNTNVVLWDADLSSIYNNSITVKEVSNTNSQFYAMCLFNSKYASIRKNQIRPSNSATNLNCVGINLGSSFNLNYRKNSVIMECLDNSIFGLPNGISQDEDFRGNIINCNVFNLNSSLSGSVSDIKNSQFSPFLASPSYGSIKNPLSNEFTAIPVNSNFKNIVSTLGSPYTYYFNSVNSKYNPKLGPYVTKYPGLKSNPCNLVYVEKNKNLEEPCPKIIPPIDLLGLVDPLRFGRKKLDSIEPDTWDYILLKNDYMQKFRTDLQSISLDYSDSLKNLCVSKIDTLIETIPDSIDYYYFSAFHFLNHLDSNRWINLKNEINGIIPIHNELNYLTDYIDILNSLFQNNFDSIYVSTIQNKLDTIKLSGTLVSSKARSLYCYLYQIDCPPTLVNFIDSQTLQLYDSIKYTFGPNPFNGNLNVNIINNYSVSQQVQVVINPFSSNIPIYDQVHVISAGSTISLNLQTQNWPTNFYALLLLYSVYYHSEIIYKP